MVSPSTGFYDGTHHLGLISKLETRFFLGGVPFERNVFTFKETRTRFVQQLDSRLPL